MNKRFGHIRQIAFVVNNIDQAMEYWAGILGIGPFFIKRAIRFSDYVYRGEVMESPQISIALANSGQLQIELIQQHDDHPSIYREFQQQSGQGLQHVAAWGTRAEFDQRRSALLEQGLSIVQECTIAASGVRLVYFSTEQGPGGFIYELADLLEPAQQERIQNVAAQAEQWDGKTFYYDVSK